MKLYTFDSLVGTTYTSFVDPDIIPYGGPIGWIEDKIDKLFPKWPPETPVEKYREYMENQASLMGVEWPPEMFVAYLDLAERLIRQGYDPIEAFKMAASAMQNLWLLMQASPGIFADVMTALQVGAVIILVGAALLMLTNPVTTSPDRVTPAKTTYMMEIPGTIIGADCVGVTMKGRGLYVGCGWAVWGFIQKNIGYKRAYHQDGFVLEPYYKRIVKSGFTYQVTIWHTLHMSFVGFLRQFTGAYYVLWDYYKDRNIREDQVGTIKEANLWCEHPKDMAGEPI